MARYLIEGLRSSRTQATNLPTAQMVFDLKDPSQIPVISEMFFFGLHAHIDYKPVMNAEDLRKGLSSIDRAVMV